MGLVTVWGPAPRVSLVEPVQIISLTGNLLNYLHGEQAINEVQIVGSGETYRFKPAHAPVTFPKRTSGYSEVRSGLGRSDRHLDEWSLRFLHEYLPLTPTEGEILDLGTGNGLFAIEAINYLSARGLLPERPPALGAEVEEGLFQVITIEGDPENILGENNHRKVYAVDVDFEELTRVWYRTPIALRRYMYPFLGAFPTLYASDPNKWGEDLGSEPFRANLLRINDGEKNVWFMYEFALPANEKIGAVHMARFHFDTPDEMLEGLEILYERSLPGTYICLTSNTVYVGPFQQYILALEARRAEGDRTPMVVDTSFLKDRYDDRFPRRITLWDPDSFTNLLESTGWEVVETGYYGEPAGRDDNRAGVEYPNKTRAGIIGIKR